MEGPSLALSLAVGALLVGSVADILYRVGQQRGIDTGVFLFWQSAIFTGALWLGAGVVGQVTEIMSGTWVWGLPGGLLSYIGLYLFVHSLRTGDASVNAPVFRLNFVVAAAGGMLLLNEPINVPKIAGILLAVVSVLSLLNLRALRLGGPARQSLITVVAASLLFGTVGVLAKQALNEGSLAVPLILTQTVSFTAASVGYVLWTRRWRPNRATLLYAPPISALQLVWSILLFQALALGDASIIYPVVQLSFVLTAVMGVVFLSEPINRMKVAGLALAVVAVAVLSLA
ncbi:MAG: DMT family transporter [Chloroflexi bacterium]|nr:DMT family transporter [Chloroflexota bacterium]